MATNDPSQPVTSPCPDCSIRVGLTDRSGYALPNETALDASRKAGTAAYLVSHDYPSGSPYQGIRCPGSGKKVAA